MAHWITINARLDSILKSIPAVSLNTEFNETDLEKVKGDLIKIPALLKPILTVYDEGKKKQSNTSKPCPEQELYSVYAASFDRLRTLATNGVPTTLENAINLLWGNETRFLVSLLEQLIADTHKAHLSSTATLQSIFIVLERHIRNARNSDLVINPYHAGDDDQTLEDCRRIITAYHEQCQHILPTLALLVMHLRSVASSNGAALPRVEYAAQVVENIIFALDAIADLFPLSPHQA